MSESLRRARDLDVIDAVDGQPRRRLSGVAWRVTREGRDPLQGAASNSRWCDGSFDVLYTCAERDGALAEIYSLLAAQPVFPSKLRSFVHKIEYSVEKALIVGDVGGLAAFGVDTARYKERNYSRTQSVAEAAYFLDFDALHIPSARWPCQNLVLFTDHVGPASIGVVESDKDPVDWSLWRKKVAIRP